MVFTNAAQFPSYGSSSFITNVFKHHGFTNIQCGKSSGFCLNFERNHRSDFNLYNPFSHLTVLDPCKAGQIYENRLGQNNFTAKWEKGEPLVLKNVWQYCRKASGSDKQQPAESTT